MTHSPCIFKFFGNMLVFILMISVSGCDKNKQVTDEKLKTIELFDRHHDMEFSHVRLVSLEKGDSINLGDQLELKIYEDEFFILDHFQQKVFRFDSNGRYLNSIGKSGRGPEEYIGLADFLVKDDVVEVLWGHGKYSGISKYSLDGGFIESRKYDIVAVAFEKIANNYLFYSSYNRHHKYRINVFSPQGDSLKSYLPNNASLLTVDQDVFYKSGDVVYFAESFNNTLYRLNEEKLLPEIRVDFDDYSIPKEFFKLKGPQGFELLLKNGFGNIKEFFQNDELLFLNTVIQSRKDTYLKQVAITRDGKVSTKKIQADEHYLRFPQCLQGNELVYLIHPFDIMQNEEKFLRMPLDQTKRISELEEDDNPIIAFCAIKE